MKTDHGKSKKEKSRQEQRRRGQSKFPIRMIPVMLMFCFQPLIVMGKTVTIYLEQYPWFPDGSSQYDFFMYGKAVVFQILVVWMLLVLVDRRLIGGRKCNWNRSFCLLVGYAVLVILSTVFSISHVLSLKGMWEQGETVWVLLGYVLAAYSCSQLAETERDIHLALTALLIGTVFQALLGLAQLAGQDFWSSEFGKWLITLGLGAEVRENLVFSFAQSSRNQVYMALYNPNYAGVYLVMVIPVLAFWGSGLHKRGQRIAVGLVCTALLICLVGSGSRTGMAVLALLCLLAALWRCPKRSRIPVAAAVLILSLAGGLVYDAATGHSLRKGLVKTVTKKENYVIDEMSVEGSLVKLHCKGEELLVDLTAENGEVLPVVYRSETDSSETGAENVSGRTTETSTEHAEDEVFLEWDEERSCYHPAIEGGQKLRLSAGESGGQYFLCVNGGLLDWYFVKEDLQENFAFVNQYGKKDDLETAPTVLPGYEKALSGRGYLWGRTIPLLKDTILLGSGPDTFILKFPQSDYLGRYHSSLRMYQEIPSKPHSLYLQVGVQTGVLSLLCLLVFWGWYLWDSFCLYFRGWKTELPIGQNRTKADSAVPKHHLLQTADDPLYRLGGGIALGIFGYLLMGIMNDSNLATAPVFWCLLGTGIAANHLTRNACILSVIVV